jgi:hypothetical protein
MLIGSARYGDSDAPTPEVAPNNPFGVAFVGAYTMRTQSRTPAARPLDLSSLHQGPKADHLVALTSTKHEDHRLAASFGSYMYLRRKTALGIA